MNEQVKRQSCMRAAQYLSNLAKVIRSAGREEATAINTLEMLLPSMDAALVLTVKELRAMFGVAKDE